MENKIILKHNKVPNLKKPSFLVDKPLHKKLDEYELTKNMNCSHFCLFCSKPAGGKTTQIVSFLNTPELFFKVFNNIFLFMGQNSRDSIKGSFFDTELPPECIYDELTYENLNEVFEKIKELSSEGKTSLIIFDDVQAQLKNKEIEKLLKQISGNRRHIRATIWMANQNYSAIPKPIRNHITDIFLFDVSKFELDQINEEHFNFDKKLYDNIIKECFNNYHDFLYMNTRKKQLFNNWDEIILS